MVIYAGHVALVITVLINAYMQNRHFRRIRLLEHRRQENNLLFMISELQKFQELKQWEIVEVINQDINHHWQILHYIITPRPWWWALFKKPQWQRQLDQLRQKETVVFTRYGELNSAFLRRSGGPNNSED